MSQPGRSSRFLPRDLSDPTARRVILSLTGIIGVLAALSALQLWLIVTSHPGGLGVDFNQYHGHTARWLENGQFYLPRQLAGPTTVMDGDPLYPPVVLYLLVPFQALPAVVWWIVPLGIIGYVFVRLRPVPWTWPILALIALWPRTPALIYYGNPGMWSVAVIAAGVMWCWPTPLLLFKPSLAPFAIIGIGSRGWFVTFAFVVVASLPFGMLWLDYLTVLRNSSVPLSYSLLDLPITIAPVVAWLGRSDPTMGWQVRRPGTRASRPVTPGDAAGDGAGASPDA